VHTTFGSWDLPGLMTSMPDAGRSSARRPSASPTAPRSCSSARRRPAPSPGKPSRGATTIAVYTYAGDVNFDGLVDASDYGIIDNYYQFPGTTGYANGDFNYDGVIDAGDYGIIDNTSRTKARRSRWRAGRRGSGIVGVTAVPDRRRCPSSASRREFAGRRPSSSA
jgi:hypothetical protein